MNKKRQSAMMEHTLQELYLRNSKRGYLRKTKVLVLLTSHIIGMDSGLSYLKMLNDENINLRITVEEEVLKVFSAQELVRKTGNDDWISPILLNELIIDDIDSILVPVLSYSLVHDILSFNERRTFVRLIMTAMLKGKKVFALKTGADPYHPGWKMKGLDKSTNLFTRKLNERLFELKALGITLLTDNERADFKNAARKKTVVTDAFVRYVHQENFTQIVITNGSIITPLARDTAKELNIALILQ